MNEAWFAIQNGPLRTAMAEIAHVHRLIGLNVPAVVELFQQHQAQPGVDEERADRGARHGVEPTARPAAA